jgi:hypothetical protein
MVNVRRPAAVDLSGLGPKIFNPEFALAVLGAPTLGVLAAVRSRSLGLTALGVALIWPGRELRPPAHSCDRPGASVCRLGALSFMS